MRNPHAGKAAFGMAAAMALVGTAVAIYASAPTSAAPLDPGQVVADDGARDVDFNEGWQFFLVTRTPTGPTNSQNITDPAEYPSATLSAPNYDDSSWRTLTVPHDFSIEGPKLSANSGGTAQGYMQGGLAWYRKNFTVPDSLRDASKRVMVDFEGVYQNSVVYLNGEELGNYPSGYTGFSYDLTDKLRYGEPNVLAVKVQARASSGRWYTGAGIFRPVRLVVTDPVRIVREGVVLASPDLEATYTADGSARLQVTANTYSDASNGLISLTTTVLDAAGAPVATHSTGTLETNPSTAAALSDTVTVPGVRLWHPWNLGDPYQYTVRTQVYYLANGTSETRLVDTVDTRYGFRWVEVAPTDTTDAVTAQSTGGLYVNGLYTKVQGVDLHHDQGALGAAAWKDAFYRQFSILKSEGVNAYRTAHNPPSKQVIEVASELGFLVTEEAYDGWGATKATYDFGRAFLVTVPANWAGFRAHGLAAPPEPGVSYAGAQYVWSDWVIQEMVRRDINEPSVVMWSIGNENRGSGTRPSWLDGTQYNPLGASGVTATTFNEYTEAVRLGEDVRAIDGTRYVVYGGDHQRTPAAVDATWGRVNRYLDGFGLNYNTATSVDVLAQRFGEPVNSGESGTFFYESESSSQTSSRGVYLDAPVYNSGTNQTPGSRGGSNYDNDFASWTMSNEYGLKKDRDRKSFIGEFIWSGFDYIGEPTPYSVYPVGVSSFGTVDTAGFPKDSYYLFRSQWTDKTASPLVHILPGNWQESKWQERETVHVWVNSNHRTVELFLNGTSLGTKSFDVKKTADGREYYETSEPTGDDKSWPSGQQTVECETGIRAGEHSYASPNATVVSASGDSAIAAGAACGRLHLAWEVPYEAGELVAKAYTDPSKTTLAATDTVRTAGAPYSFDLKPDKSVIKADGRALSYVEVDVVDEAGSVVPDAGGLVRFDVTGGAIVGVDNGQQESSELYKWGNVERSAHSERSAYMGKVLVIVQSDKGAVGDVKLTVSGDGLVSRTVRIAATADGTGAAPVQDVPAAAVVSVAGPSFTTATGVVPVLPAAVDVTYSDPAAGTYTVARPVVWAPVTAAQVAAEGTVALTGAVAGVGAPVAGTLKVMDSTLQDVAANPGIGANSQVFTFAGLSLGNALRQGALATASFTGATASYPNNMLVSGTGQSWTNAYSRGAAVLLPAYSLSRPFEDVEFFWDSPRLFTEVRLAFTDNGGSRTRPSAAEVEYWDGLEWRAVAGQADTWAAASNAFSTFAFDPVVSTRVRVRMANPTPYTANGNLQIVNAQVTGYLSDVPDKSVLEALLADARARVEADYTAASWAASGVAGRVVEAQAVVDSAAATRPDVATALGNLQAALDALVARGDTTALAALVGGVGGYAEADYTAATWPAFDTALAAAGALVAAPADATAAQVASALANLQAAVTGLVPRVATAGLEAAVAAAEATLAALDPEDYTTGSWTELNIKLLEARAAVDAVVLDHPTQAAAAVAQAAVDSAAGALNAARAGLTADNRALASLVATVDAAAPAEAAYTAASWAVFEAALGGARALLGDPAAVPAALAGAEAALRSAFAGLVPAADTHALAGAVDAVRALAASRGLFTEDSWAAVESALAAAEAELASPTGQAAVNQAVADLNAAVGALRARGYATSMAAFTLSPDVTGDGRGEVFAVHSSGELRLFKGAAYGFDAVHSVTGPVLPATSRVYGPGDWSNDGKADLAVIDADGKLWVHKGDGRGNIAAARTEFGHGWSNFQAVPAGDLTGDGLPDLLGADRATGKLYLYEWRANGQGFKAKREVGHGWQTVDLYAAADLDGDGKGDILGVTSTGRMLCYPGNGDGSFKRSRECGHGWSSVSLVAGADLDGDRVGDIVGRNESNGEAYFYKGLGNGGFAAKRIMATGW